MVRCESYPGKGRAVQRVGLHHRLFQERGVDKSRAAGCRGGEIRSVRQFAENLLASFSTAG